MPSQDILNDFNEAYESAFSVLGAVYQQAQEDMNMYLSDQWTAKDAQYYFENGIKKYTFNLIASRINWLDGYQRANRLSSVVQPLNKEDQPTADDYSAVLQYVFQYGDGYSAISEAAKGGWITGLNFLSLWMDYRDDPVNGDIRFSVDPLSSVIFSPYFTNTDLSDCSYVLKRKYISLEQALSLLPEHEEQIHDLYKYNGLDGKFCWLPYASNPTSFSPMMSYSEYYRQEWKTEYVVIDLLSGQQLPWTQSKKAFNDLKKTSPYLELVSKEKRIIKKHIIVNEHYITTEENQFGLDEYPFVPFFGKFEKSSIYYPNKLQSLVRIMNDPQRLLNKMTSYSAAMLGSQINSGWKYKAGALANDKSLADSGLAKNIPINDEYSLDDVQKIESSQLPPSFLEMQNTYNKLTTEVFGINEAAFGVPFSGSESGILMQLRQSAALIPLQGIFDQLRDSQKHLSRKILKMTQTWTPAKLNQILRHAPQPQYYDPGFLKCDISIQESLLTDTQRQMHFAQLVELRNLTGGESSPITPMMLIEACPIQGGAKLREQIQNNILQSEQKAQQQQHSESELLHATIDNIKAEAVSKLASAKEKINKESLNDALIAEREAKVEREKALTIMDYMKGLKEFSQFSEQEIQAFYQAFLEAQQLQKLQTKPFFEESIL